MKLLVIAADAACPDYIFGKKHLFPNLCKLIDSGASSAYSAYVQRGYRGSYSSEQNWASIYTGLSPEQHGIGAHHGIQETMPVMSSFQGLQPLWQVINDAGLTVGLWQGDCLDDPVQVKGYVVSGRYTPIFTPSENREAKRTIQVSDKRMESYLEGDPPPRLYPRTLRQQGLRFEDIQANPSLIWQVANEKEFQPMLDNFEQELAYWFGAMSRAQRDRPVDVMWWFTPTTDILPHFTLWCDDNPVLIKAYQMLDQYLGAFIQEFSPENVVFLSDHGQKNFREQIRCSNQEIAYEAFKAHDKVVWMDNGYLAFEALNGGLLFTAHSLNGVFIASGNQIRQTEVTNMRTIDIYPTLLELLGVEIPDGRAGYVMDIFNRRVKNIAKLVQPGALQHRQAALIQTHEISVMDVILNELFLSSRFLKITVIGEEKYEEIFRNNPRVTNFLPFEQFHPESFDEIYCGFYNETTGSISHIRVR